MLRKKNKQQKKKLLYDFQVELETINTETVVARALLLPGCQAQGKNEREALDRLKSAIELYLLESKSFSFRSIEEFQDIPIIYALVEFRGFLFAATNRDMILKSKNTFLGSWIRVELTQSPSKFFNPHRTGKSDTEGDYVTQIYTLGKFSPVGKPLHLYAGTNLNGTAYQTEDGEKWEEAFCTNEDRIHCLVPFRGKLYIGTSSQGKIYAFDGSVLKPAGSLNETAITCMAIYHQQLYIGTYSNGNIYASPDGHVWKLVASTEQTFIQCLKEYQGDLYAGTSSTKGVGIFKTSNGKDWMKVYENPQFLNIYSMEVFGNALYVGLGSSSRILRTEDGMNWQTVYAADEEGVRAFCQFDDYLYATTELKGKIIRSTFDSGSIPEIRDVQIDVQSSSEVIITWNTNIPSTSTIYYREKKEKEPVYDFEWKINQLDRVEKHEMRISNLKADQEYECQLISANRESSVSSKMGLNFKTKPIFPPQISSTTHPSNQWSNQSKAVFQLEFPDGIQECCYCFNQSPDVLWDQIESLMTSEKTLVFDTPLQGVWYLHVMGVDGIGNRGVQTTAYRFQVDLEAWPPSDVSSPTHPNAQQWIANDKPVIQWVPPEDFSGIKGYYLKVDQLEHTIPTSETGEWTESNCVSLGSLADGIWYAHVITEDQSGNLGNTAAHFQFKIDTHVSAPEIISMTHPSSDVWYASNQVQFQWLEPQDFSGIAKYYYQFDSDSESEVIPTQENAITKNHFEMKDISDGFWYFHLRSQDQAGNISKTTSHFKVCIDTYAASPVITSRSHPQSLHWSNQPQAVFQWEAPTDDSGVKGYFFILDQNSKTRPDEKTGIWTEQRELSIQVMEDGIWFFHLVMKDAAGNLSEPDHYELRVDTQIAQPQIQSTSHPDENKWYTVTQAVFQLIPPPDLSGIVGFYYQLDTSSENFDVDQSSFSEAPKIQIPIQEEGIYFLKVVCRDAAGNRGSVPALYRIQSDLRVLTPILHSPSHPDPQKWYRSKSVQIVIDAPPDLSGIWGYYVKFDQNEAYEFNETQMEFVQKSDFEIEVSGEGIGFIHVVARDQAGNISSVIHFKVQIAMEILPPQVKSPTHPLEHWSNHQSPIFQWEPQTSLSEVEGYYFFIDSQETTIPQPDQAQWTTELQYKSNPLPEGKHYFHIIAKDRVGNLSIKASHYPIWIDITPPHSKMNPLSLFSNQSEIQVSWEAEDPFSGVVNYDIQVKEGMNGVWRDWLTTTTQTSSTYLAESGKKTFFRCRARDGVGNVGEFSSQEIISTTVDLTPPPPVIELKATAQPLGKILLQFTPVTDEISGTAFYRIYRWTQVENDKKLISTDGMNVPEYLDSDEQLKDGTTYFYCVQPVDHVGNEQIQGNATASAISDHYALTPIVTSTTHVLGAWSSNPVVTLNWMPVLDASGIYGYYYILDQNAQTVVDPKKAQFTKDLTFTMGPLKSGQWFFHLIMQDRAGNLSPIAHSCIKIDSDQPQSPTIVCLTHPNSNQWYTNASVEFEIILPEKLSGWDGYYYVWTQESRTELNSQNSTRSIEKKLTLNMDKIGKWYLKIMGRDLAGNFSNAVQYEVSYSGHFGSPPSIFCSTHPRESKIETNNSPVFIWEDKKTDHWVPSGYVYKLSKNESEILSMQDSFTKEKTIKFESLEDGVWFFHLSTVDQNGTLSPLIAKKKISIQQAISISGKFLSKNGVQGIAGIRIEWLQNDKVIGTIETNANGEFSILLTSSGKHDLKFYEPNFPVLWLKNILITLDSITDQWVFSEDLGIFPAVVDSGPVQFYYFLKEDCNVVIEVFDSKGVLIHKLEEKKSGGCYNYSIWDASPYTTGEYLYKLTAKSILKGSMSRFNIKKFKINKKQKMMIEAMK